MDDLLMQFPILKPKVNEFLIEELQRNSHLDWNTTAFILQPPVIFTGFIAGLIRKWLIVGQSCVQDDNELGYRCFYSLCDEFPITTINFTVSAPPHSFQTSL